MHHNEEYFCEIPVDMKVHCFCCRGNEIIIDVVLKSNAAFNVFTHREMEALYCSEQRVRGSFAPYLVSFEHFFTNE
uniref:Uncharacterized protein n=1 Tax=Physcomitrium patens TaxID=3218 RepID=A0A2K1I9F4_PHYPA|nr:hypothetical protein PHYPA_031301 [Physcomitrium patens]